MAQDGYAIDMVFCIDATGSMNGLIDMVKENAINFYSDVINTLEKKNKHASQIRVKVVVFRDYVADKKDAMLVTDFFDLPKETSEFKECINSIVARGGGDEPEDGLEALAYAIRSKWNTASTKRRHIIVVWTDASTHDLGYGKSVSGYPSNMAADIVELSEWWGDGYGQSESEYMDQSAKRLILFAPDYVKGVETTWNKISDNWDEVIHVAAKAGAGLAEVDYGEVLDSIANSV